MPYVAKLSFVAPGPRDVQQGQEVADDDPVVKGREELFVRTSEPQVRERVVAFGPDGPVTESEALRAPASSKRPGRPRKAAEAK